MSIHVFCLSTRRPPWPAEFGVIDEADVQPKGVGPESVGGRRTLRHRPAARQLVNRHSPGPARVGRVTACRASRIAAGFSGASTDVGYVVTGR